MDVRPYTAGDREACLAIFDSNVPDYFQAGERSGLAEFLEQPGCTYLVMEHDGAVVGCGGYRSTEDPPVGRLVWGMVRRDLQRQGLGRFLLYLRLKELSKSGGVQRVSLTTSPQAAPFFEREGFRVIEAGAGVVEMVKKLAVCP